SVLIFILVNPLNTNYHTEFNPVSKKMMAFHH
ncbi:MAG: hypothetical protein ACJA0I_001609, partial [Gammaproteobacteria bacterium]